MNTFSGPKPISLGQLKWVHMIVYAVKNVKCLVDDLKINFILLRFKI